MKLTPFPFTVWAIRQLGRSGSKGTPLRDVGQSGDVVPVRFAHRPAERPPLVRERLQVQNVLHVSEALYFIVIDDHDKIVKPVLGREQNGLPVRAFVAFAVAQDGENAVRKSVPLGSQRHPAGDRQSVAQRAGRKLDARNPVRRDVAGQPRAVDVEAVQPLQRKEAAFRQRGVQTGTGMPLAEDQPVAAGIVRRLRPHPHNPPVQNGQDLRHRHRTGHVRTLRKAGHLDRVNPDLAGKLAQIHTLLK